MLLNAVLPVVLVSFALVIPGIIWAWWRYPAADGATRLSVGIALGFVFQVQVCALLAIGPKITAVSVTVATVIGAGLAVFLVWLTRHHAYGRAKGVFTWHSAQLVALLAVVVAPRLLPLAMFAIPPGWDTSFHSLLASTTVNTGRLPTWQPFEQIPSNYPYGPHVFIAQISLITGIAPASVFGVLIFVVAPLVTCLAIYALARRALGAHAYALGAVAAYGLLGNWGSIEYPLWGGLPNELAFFLLLVFLCVLFAPRFERTRIVVGGIILGAIALTHHQVMLTTAILLASYVACLLSWNYLRARSNANWIPVRALLKRLMLMCLVAVVSVSYYIIPIGLRVTKLGSTRALQYYDDYSGVVFGKNGLLLWELALFGVALILAGMYNTRVYTRKNARRTTVAMPDLARTFVATSIAALLLAFFFGYNVWRYYSFHFTPSHQPYTLFTPTRFLTDLTYFLALPAGIPLAIAWQWPARWGKTATGFVRQKARLIANLGARIAIATVVLTICWGYLSGQLNPAIGHLPPGQAEAFAWLKSHTSADTLIVNPDADAIWAPYFTQREVAYTPVPTSEFISGYVAEKQALAGVLLQTLDQTPGGRVVAFAGTGNALHALSGRPVALVSELPVVGMTNSPAFTAGLESVYLLGNALTFSEGSLDAKNPVALQWWTRRGDPAAGWMTSAAPPDGWSAATPDASHLHSVMYFRMVLTTALPAGAQVACQAQNGAVLFVDGHEIQNGCDRSATLLPILSTPGPHVLGLRMDLGPAGIDPWYNVALQEPRQ